MLRTYRAGTATVCRLKFRSKRNTVKSSERRSHGQVPVPSQRTGEISDGRLQRLGVLGDWNDPYLTMRPETEAEEIRALGEILGKGFIYRRPETRELVF